MSSDDEDDVVTLMLGHLATKRIHRSCGVHPVKKKREELGEYHQLVLELRNYPDRFRNYMRLTVEQFDEVLEWVSPLICKKTTNWRRPITPGERLAICLRFLGTGNSYISLADSYRVGSSTVALIVPEVCQALWDVLVHTYMPFPKSPNDWEKIAQGFKFWDYPNCCGAIDGKHVVMFAPPNSGSLYFNYKTTFSTVLLALVDARYSFICVDIGSYGKNSDGGIFHHSLLGQGFLNNTLQFPEPKTLPGAEEKGPVQHVIVGDAAFPLSLNIMRPYPACPPRETKEEKLMRRIFNYRLSRARRVSENAFGILASRWRIYHSKIQVEAESVNKIVMATTVLHNYLQRDTTPVQACRMSDQEFEAAEGLEPLDGIGHRPPDDAVDVRHFYKKYFSSEAGSVPWQNHTVTRMS